MILENNLKFIDKQKVHLEEKIINIKNEIIYFDKIKQFLIDNYEKIAKAIGHEILYINFGRIGSGSIFFVFKPDEDFNFYRFEKSISVLHYCEDICYVWYMGDFTLKIEIL